MTGLEQDAALIRELLAYSGVTAAEIAREAGVDPKTIQRPSAGTATTRLSQRTLEKLQAAYPGFPGWAQHYAQALKSYAADQRDGVSTAAATFAETKAPYRGRDLARDRDLVELAEFDVAYGLGGTFIHEQHVEARMRTFSRSWIRQFTPSPVESLYWATGNGTSMMPAILDNDILLIDTMQRTPRMWDQFWAIDMHGMGMIKALRPGKDGAMRILSMNPDWPEDDAYDGEMNIVGRVVAIVRKV